MPEGAIEKSHSGSLFYFIYFLFYFTSLVYFLTVLGLCCCADLSMVAASGVYSLVAMPRLLTVVASLVMKHSL